MSTSHSCFTPPVSSRPAGTLRRLSAQNTVVATTPGHPVGSPRATVAAMAEQEHAIAGINGDVFYLSDPTSVPRAA